MAATGKKFLPVDVSHHAALRQRYHDAKERERLAKAEADEIKDEIKHLVWREDHYAHLSGAGLDGLELFVGGVPVLRFTVTRPVKFQSAKFKADHPDLAARYIQPSAPQVALTEVGE